MSTGQPPTVHSALVVGARTQRQGTGPFIAAGLAAAGMPVIGIVGTSVGSVENAVSALERDWQLSPSGYTDLSEALAALQPLAVAICSPWRFHEQQLRTVAKAGCHCLVEKPLAWPAGEEQVKALVEDYHRRGLLLQVVDQWPTTLDAFSRLHEGLPETVERFRMRLSPLSIGEDMVTDSAPHFLGMLSALCGPGNCENVTLHRESEDALELHCDYRTGSGLCGASLRLQTQVERPRPAWYQVNELRADREVDMPEYQQYLVGAEQRIPLEDPMELVTRRFVDAVEGGDQTDCQGLISTHRNLLALAAAWN